MATAIKSTTKVKKVVEVDEPTIMLNLSEDEARFLADVFARIGGSPFHTRRKHQETITAALATAGVYYKDNVFDITGNLNCQ